MAIPVLNSFLEKAGLRRIAITEDGNCFYRALSLAYYKDEGLHHTLRLMTMNRLREDTDMYEAYFANCNFKRCIIANRREGVWNTGIADIIPAVVTDLLNICLVIHNYDTDTQTMQIHEYGNGNGDRERINMLRTNDNHYDLLEK